MGSSGGKGIIIFFPYGQKHNFSLLTVLYAVQITPAKEKIIILDEDNFKEMRKMEEQEI